MLAALKARMWQTMSHPGTCKTYRLIVSISVQVPLQVRVAGPPPLPPLPKVREQMVSVSKISKRRKKSLSSRRTSTPELKMCPLAFKRFLHGSFTVSYGYGSLLSLVDSL